MQPASALILTYHAVEPGPPPLFVDPGLFARHVDELARAGARPLTVCGLRDALARGDVPEQAVALTFDDAFASVAEHAAPLLAERGWPATVFAVAGHLGGSNDWPTQPASAPRRPLATAAQLAELAAQGWEVGSHGMTHRPLTQVAESDALREVAASRERLEERVGVEVPSFALPYGAPANEEAAALVRSTYRAACSSRMRRADPQVDAHELPRVDVHYLRAPALLRRAVEGGLESYLRARSLASRMRRVVRSDHAEETR